MSSPGGLAEMLRDVYRTLEDKFYTLLDWLEDHNIPAYRVHDWLEDHGIPPFPAFLCVMFIAVSGILIALTSAGAETYTATILVQDKSGNPVPNARVVLELESGYTLSQRTDASGYAYFLELPEKPVSVSVSAEGYESVKKRPLTESEATITLKPSPKKKMEVCIRPVDSENGTLASVSIIGVYDYRGTKASKTFKLDEVYGVYCAEFPDGTTVKVNIVGGDYKTVEKTVTAPHPRENPLEITVYRKDTKAGLAPTTYRLAVQVLYDGEPEKASVSIKRENGTKILSTKQTGDDGRAVLNVPSAGKYIVEAVSSGKHRGKRAAKKITVVDNTEVTIDLAKEKGATGESGTLKKVTSRP
ncbi:MAG TPA: carboxypeptidase regulatory-like domain-containing protein, partial [Euryarchaeota archaeon]|nr:carboxypeptidase regulatory-like domain-containing protein [Euryarchaeota archaeon]